MRAVLIILALSGLAVVGLSYVGESLTLSAMGQVTVTGGGAVMTPGHPDGLFNCLKSLYRIWGYVRYAGILVVVLAIVGWRRRPGA